MNRKHPAFDYSVCVSCGICAQACPVSCLAMTREGKQGKYKNVFPEVTGDSCLGCGVCAKACPMDAIAMQEAAEEA